MSIYGKICPKCNIELRPLKNGVDVIEMAIDGPQAIWRADLWHCPECGLQVILQFADKPYIRIWDDDWDQQLELAKTVNRGNVYPIFLNAHERDEHKANTPCPKT